VLGEREEAAARAIGFVPMTTLWWAEGERLLGRLAIRHRLTPALEEAGGHIGYDVRPSARRQGHATAMLAAALPIARSLGIIEALLTCDDTNTASQRVIEANGGRFVDMAGQKRRYRVPTRS
jgi:predicted acetyltransferase